MQTHGEVWGCFGILRIAQTLSKAGTPDLKLEDVHYLQVIALSTIAKTRRGHLLGFVNECPSGFKTEHVTTSTKGELKCWTWLIRMHFTMRFYVNDGCVLSSATGGVYQNLVTNWNCLLRNQDHLLTQKAYRNLSSNWALPWHLPWMIPSWHLEILLFCIVSFNGFVDWSMRCRRWARRSWFENHISGMGCPASEGCEAKERRIEWYGTPER